MPQPETLKLGKKTPGGALGYLWEKAGDVVEVAVKDVYGLITASHGDIYEVVEAVEKVLPFVELAEADKDKELDTPVLTGQPSNDLTAALNISSATTPRGKPKKA